MRPKLHLSAPKHWINDPVGFIYYQGNYHLFYQYFPYENTWGTMHWGHAISKDLCHWEDLGIALYPSKYFDCNGCFSGSAIEIDNAMYLYYTGVVYRNPTPQNIHVTINDDFIASQSMLISSNGFHFDNFLKEQIIPVFKDNEVGHPTHTRDPKVWKYKDTYYLLMGSKYTDQNKQEQGQLLFYTSTNAVDWSYTNNYRDMRIGDMWECPDTFSINNQQLLIMSPERTMMDGKNYPSHARITTCTFDHDTCTMDSLGALQYLDYGLDMYAPQTTVDKEGRRILVGWMRMPKPGVEDWIGLITYPRVITYHDDTIYTNIHPNIDSLFTKETMSFNPSIPSKIMTTLLPNDSITIGGYKITYTTHLQVDRTDVFVPTETIGKIFNTPVIDTCQLAIYTDNHCIEIYVNDGLYVVSNIVYHLKDSITSTTNYKMFIEKETL